MRHVKHGLDVKGLILRHQAYEKWAERAPSPVSGTRSRIDSCGTG
jgi:hypothetical protein